MPLNRWTLAVVTAVVLTFPVQAQDATPRETLVDPNVFSVLSHAWPSNRQGVIRIISLAHGFEHVSTEVVAQWLEQTDAGDGNWGIAAAETLVPPGFSVLGAPRLSVQGDAIRADFEGVHTFDGDDRIQRCFALYPDRRVVTLDCGNEQ